MNTFGIFAGLAGILTGAVAMGADSPFEAATRTSLLRSFDDATGKMIRLAEAMPAETYEWRPMEGVNSVRDVLVHVAATNFGLAERLGTKPPAGVDRRKLAESMKTKPEALAVLRQSIEHMRAVLATIPAEELLPEANVFGAKAPKLRVALLPVDHAHEHLGQLIAYARMNRIAPPWSQ